MVAHHDGEGRAMHDYTTTELLVPFHQNDQRRLVALAARLAPASQGAPTRRIAKPGHAG